MVRITLDIQATAPHQRKIIGGVTDIIDPLPGEEELAGIIRQLLTEFLPAAFADQGIHMSFDFDPNFPE
ncbi:hypothetical protein [Prosthecobacter sp.]|uniref:hypothetical protein n=1 Tax=Prosthecobacter sp. TaxID=1965333 RepID=UPI00378410A6